MSFSYYNGLGDVLEIYQKSNPRAFRSNEQYRIDSEGNKVDNPLFDVTVQLANAKEIKLQRVRKRTREMKQEGLGFKGTTFGTTLEAQADWTSLLIAIILELTGAIPSGTVKYPCKILDSKGELIEFANVGEIIQFFMLGVADVYTHYQEDGVLEDTIKDAKTFEELNAIVDSR